MECVKILISDQSLVNFRIVFHRAGAKRVKSFFNAVIQVGKFQEVSHNIQFTDFGKFQVLLSQVFFGNTVF